jgi:hypothetical protein
MYKPYQRYLHRLHFAFAVAHALGFPLFPTSRFLATAFNTQAITVLHLTVAHSLLFTEALFTIHNSILRLH